MTTYTADQMAAALEKLPKFIERERVNAARRALRRARTTAINRLRSRGVGRSLWGKKAVGAKAAVKVENPREAPDGTVRGRLVLKGLAAMQEEGGRTKPHLIKAREGLLALKLSGGRLGFARTVHHPGSRIPAFPFAKPAMESELSKVKSDLDASLQRALDKALG